MCFVKNEELEVVELPVTVNFKKEDGIVGKIMLTKGVLVEDMVLAPAFAIDEKGNKILVEVSIIDRQFMRR